MKNKKIAELYLLVLGALLIIGSCSNPVDFLQNESDSPGNTGNLTVAFGDGVGAKTIVPDFSTAVDHYEISGSGPSVEDAFGPQVISSSSTLNDLSIGEWSIVVEGIDADGEVVARGSETVAIESGTNYLNMDVVFLQDGNGSLDVTVSWPGTANVDQVLVSLDGETAVDIYDGSDTASFLRSDLASGDHLLSFILNDGSYLRAAILESVHIYDNQITQEEIVLTSDQISSPPQTPVMQAAEINPDEQVVVSWDGSGVLTESEFVLQRDTVETFDDSPAEIAVLPSNTGSYTDSSVDAGAEYFYRVAAQNSFGRSSWSGYDSAAIPAPGDVLWSFSTGGDIEHSPALAADGTIYVSSNDNYVYAINPDGSEKWKYYIGGNGRSSPTVGADGSVYVGVGWDETKVVALYPDGSLKWEYVTNNGIYDSPAIGPSGTVYISDGNGGLHAVDPETGTQIWRNNDVEASSSPVISPDGTIIYVTYSYWLYAISTADGTSEWTYNDVDYVKTPAIGSDGTLYLGTYNIGSAGGRLLSLDPADGQPLWVQDYNQDFIGAPSLGPNDTLYTGSAGGVYAVSTTDGSMKWLFSGAVDKTTGTAVGADGTVYAGSSNSDDRLYALDSTDGSKKWEFATGYSIIAPPAIADDGTLYLASDGSTLYALKSDSNGLAQSPWPTFQQNNRRTGLQP